EEPESRNGTVEKEKRQETEPILKRKESVPETLESRHGDGKGEDAVADKAITKQIYEQMTDKEKAEWMGIDGSDMNGLIQRFKKKMEQIGLRYSVPEMTEVFMELHGVEGRQKKLDYDSLHWNKIR
ncbi:MAG: hypothetical protein IJ733_12960, partial [Lachnospiraceae bacterium]|nr:hypothetical protein [Lachnospiraceae bacterium]